MAALVSTPMFVEDSVFRLVVVIAFRADEVRTAASDSGEDANLCRCQVADRGGREPENCVPVRAERAVVERPEICAVRVPSFEAVRLEIWVEAKAPANVATLWLKVRGGQARELCREMPGPASRPKRQIGRAELAEMNSTTCPIARSSARQLSGCKLPDIGRGQRLDISRGHALDIGRRHRRSVGSHGAVPLEMKWTHLWRCCLKH